MLGFSDKDWIAYRNESIKKIVSQISKWSEDRIAWFSRLLDLVRENDFETALKLFEEEFKPEEVKTEDYGDLDRLKLDLNCLRDSSEELDESVELDLDEYLDYEEDLEDYGGGDEEFGFVFDDFDDEDLDENLDEDFEVIKVSDDLVLLKPKEKTKSKSKEKQKFSGSPGGDPEFFESYERPSMDFDFDDDMFKYGECIIRIPEDANERLILEIIDKLSELSLKKLKQVRRFVHAWHYNPNFEKAKRAYFNWGKPRRISKLDRLERIWDEVIREKENGDKENKEEYEEDELGGDEESYEITEMIDWECFDWDEA